MGKDFLYKFDQGPLESEAGLKSDWTIGNCRRAVQFYVWSQKGLFLKPEEVLCPAGYYETGVFVSKPDQPFSFDLLKDGDVIYAEKIRNKQGESIDKSERAFEKKDDYIISLHTALFTGENGKEIWHATSIEGKSCYWSKEKFLFHYRPIAAKRI